MQRIVVKHLNKIKGTPAEISILLSAKYVNCYENNILGLGKDVCILCMTVIMLFVDMCMHDVCIVYACIYSCMYMRMYACMHA